MSKRFIEELLAEFDKPAEIHEETARKVEDARETEEEASSSAEPIEDANGASCLENRVGSGGRRRSTDPIQANAIMRENAEILHRIMKKKSIDIEESQGDAERYVHLTIVDEPSVITFHVNHYFGDVKCPIPTC